MSQTAPQDDALPNSVVPIRTGEGRSLLGRLWDRPGLFSVMAILLTGVIPLGVFLAIGLCEDTLFLQGNRRGGPNNGLLEDYIFLTYFLVVPLLLLGMRHVVNLGYEALNSLIPLLRFKGEETTKTGEPDDSDLSGANESEMTKDECSELFRLYEHLYGGLSHRRAKASKVPVAYKRVYRSLRWWHITTIVIGIGFFLQSTESHWSAESNYGFDIWASGDHLLGFRARLIYELFVYVLVVPFVLRRIIASIFVIHHSMSVVGNKNALKFVRHSADQAGGLGLFGKTSLANVVAVLPFLIMIVTYVVTYPPMAQLTAGIVVFVLLVPCSFFWTLLAARTAMIQAKQPSLQALATSCNRAYEFGKSALDNYLHSPDPKQLKLFEQKMLVIEKATALLEGVRGEPNWPFNKHILTRFISTLVGIIVASLGALATSWAG